MGRGWETKQCELGIGEAGASSRKGGTHISHLACCLPGAPVTWHMGYISCVVNTGSDSREGEAEPEQDTGSPYWKLGE